MHISEKIWYIIQEKSRYWSNDLLAYVTYFENNKAFDSRKATGLSWAGKTEHEPIITENVLLSGYEVLGEVSRWSTSNVVWRIKDPRGFIFEIYSGNMMEIIRCSAVSKGIVQDKCILGFDKGKVILLPEGSEPYKQAVAATVIRNTLPSKQSLIQFDCYTDKDGNEFQYLGEFYNIKHVSGYRWVGRIEHRTIKYTIPSTKYHYFRYLGDGHKSLPRTKNGDVFLSSNPKVLHNGSVASNTPENPLGYINDNIHRIHGMGRLSCYDIRGVVKSNKSVLTLKMIEEGSQWINKVRILQYGNLNYYLENDKLVRVDIYDYSLSYDWNPFSQKILTEEFKVFSLNLVVDDSSVIPLKKL